MKKIFCHLIMLFAFLSIIPATYSQKGGSAPDTALASIAYFVNVRTPPPLPAPVTPDNERDYDTYMIIITGNDNDDDSLRPKRTITIYKVSCSTCNVLRWTKPPRVVARNSSSTNSSGNRSLSTVSGGSQLVTDEILKRRLLKTLMQQTGSATSFLQSELKTP